MKSMPLLVLATSVSSLDLSAATITRLVPVFAENVPGANGSVWRSEIRLFNSSDQTQNVTVSRMLPFPGSSCSGKTPIDLTAGRLDFIGSIGCGTGAAAVEITADDSVVIESVLINVGSIAQPHPCCPTGYQQSIPVRLVEEEYGRRRTVANLSGPIVGLPDGIRRIGRHNLGFINPNPFPIIVSLQFFHSSGDADENGFEYTTVALESLSLSQRALVIPASDTPTSGSSVGQGYWRVTASSDAGFGIYDSYVDNATNDGTFIQSH